MFFILIGLLISIGIGIFSFNKIGFKWSNLFLLILIFLCFIPLGTICDWGHEEYVMTNEYNLMPYENGEKYLKVGNNYYYFNINEESDIINDYSMVQEMYTLKKETKVIEKENIDKPIIIEYEAKQKKNFFSFGLGSPAQKFRIFIPKGTIGIK